MKTLTLAQAQNILGKISNYLEDHKEYLEQEVIDGKLIVSHYRRTPRAKYSQRKLLSYYMASDDLGIFVEYYNNRLRNLDSNKLSDIKRKNEQKIKNAINANKVKIGSLFHSSWGYEQTNVNFYQVVARKNSRVTVREIDFESVESTSWCSEDVKPLKNKFISGEKTFNLRGDSFKINSFQYASLIENEDSCFHRSWGY